MGSELLEELPDDLEAWVAERAADTGATRDDVVRRLLAAHRILDEQPNRLDAAEAPDFDARLDDVADRVGGLEADLDEKIADVRERVVQVKREANAKAPADHDHPELAGRMDEDFERLDRRLDEGFENYEEVLEYLTERTDDLDDDADDRESRLRKVANSVVDLRRRVATIEGAVEERAAVAAVRESANRQGISEAACGSCGESVRIGLLDEPACPHCGSPFDGVELGGWFRSNRLTIGDLPALESGDTRGAGNLDDAGSEQLGDLDDAGSEQSASPHDTTPDDPTESNGTGGDTSGEEAGIFEFGGGPSHDGESPDEPTVGPDGPQSEDDER